MTKRTCSRCRKVTCGGANSLDNYLARRDHAVDRLLWGEEAAAVLSSFRETIAARCRAFKSSLRLCHLPSKPSGDLVILMRTTKLLATRFGSRKTFVEKAGSAGWLASILNSSHGHCPLGRASMATPNPNRTCSLRKGSGPVGTFVRTRLL